MDIHCTICKTPLSGGLDTYGDVGREMCFDCELELNIASEGADTAFDAAWARLQKEEWLRAEQPKGNTYE